MAGRSDFQAKEVTRRINLGNKPSLALVSSRKVKGGPQPFSINEGSATSRSTSRQGKGAERRVPVTARKKPVHAKAASRDKNAGKQGIEPEACMEEIYKRMLRLMQRSLKEVRGENSVKENYLIRKGQEHRQKLDDCIDDKTDTAILSGNVEVKVLRTPNGKRIGPGAYESLSSQSKTPKSHNIMNFMQEMAREKSRKRPSHAKTATQLSDALTQASSRTKGKVQLNVRRLGPSKGAETQLTPSSNESSSKDSSNARNGGLADASYEVLLSRQHAFGESKRTIEKYRRIVEQSQSILNRTGELLSLNEEELANMKECEESQILAQELQY